MRVNCVKVWRRLLVELSRQFDDIFQINSEIVKIKCVKKFGLQFFKQLKCKFVQKSWLGPVYLQAKQRILTYYVRGSTICVVDAWSSLVEGDEGCIGPSDKLMCYDQTKIFCSTWMATFHARFTVGPIQVFISFY